MNFCSIFNELIEKNKISAYKLSKDTGISQTMIGYYRSGKNIPTIATAAKLADYFGVTTDYLMGKKNEPITDPGYRLTGEEEYIIRCFREASPDIQRAMLRIAGIGEDQT